MRLLGTVALLMLVSACATVQVGRDFDLAGFEGKVVRGVTTQPQIRSWLGAPSTTGLAVESDGQRYEEWNYYYGEGRFPNMSDAHLKSLRVTFDQRGAVRSYSWSGEPK